MDRRKTSQNADRFRDLLLRPAEGLALFHPSLDVEYGGAVGDCGYVESGRFWKLFNVFNPPDGLPRLPTPPPGSRRTEMLPNTSVLKSCNTSRFSLRGGLPFSSPPFDIDVNLNVAQNETSVAFLAYGGQSHEVDEWRDTKIMKDYLLANENVILRTFDMTPVAACGLLLLSGTTRVNAWCGGVAHSFGSNLQANIRVTLAGIDVVEVSATSEVANQEMSTQTDWAITRGPLDPVESTSPPKYCVIVRPVVVRKRERLWRKAASMLETRSSSGSLHQNARFRDAEQKRANASSSSTASPPGSKQTSSPCPDTSETEASSSSSSEDEFDDLSLNVLAQILDSILDEDVTVSAAVAEWSIVSHFVQTYDQLPDVHCKKVYVSREYLDSEVGRYSERVVDVIELLPRDEQQAPGAKHAFQASERSLDHAQSHSSPSLRSSAELDEDSISESAPTYTSSPEFYTSTTGSMNDSGSPRMLSQDSPLPPDSLADDNKYRPANLKKHVCPTCERAFSTEGHLARHSRVHTGERNHACPYPDCNTRCSSQDSMQQHYRVHLSPRSRNVSTSAARAAMARTALNAATPSSSTMIMNPPLSHHLPNSPLDSSVDFVPAPTPLGALDSQQGHNHPRYLLPPAALGVSHDLL